MNMARDHDAPTPSTRPGPGGRILVVDDEPEILALLTTHLEDQGYQTRGVATAEEALAWIGRESPDLVLLDIGLPGMPGLEALRRIRRLDPAVGIIVITGSADHALAAATLDAGALDHLRKPLDLDRMDRAIRAAIEYFIDRREGPRLGIAASEAGVISIVELRGPVELNGADRLKQVLADLVARGRIRIVADLEGVTFLDSSGLGALIAGMKTARAAGGNLHLCAPPDEVRRILTMTGLGGRIDVHPTRQEAIAALA